jgi:GNAT superfamily N-acetyltransferase
VEPVADDAVAGSARHDGIVNQRRAFSIRHANPEDVGAADLVYGYPDEWFAETALESMQVFIAEATDHPVGVIVLDGSAIEYIYVDEASRKKGLGGDLITLVAALKPTGLHVTRTDLGPELQHLLEGHGFSCADGDTYRWPGVAGST